MPALAAALRGRDVSIRVRLTLWYSAVLACGLLLFAAFIWLLLKHSLYKGLESDLAERTRSLAVFVKGELSEPGVHLAEELDEYSRGLPDNTHFALFDEGGAQVFASQKHGRLPGARRFKHEQFLRSDATFSLDSRRYLIQTAISTKQAEFILQQLRLLLLTLSPVVIALASLGGFLLSRQALKPVNEITDAARTLSINDLSQRLRVPRTGDELQHLSETWNSMLDRLADAVGRLSQFTQDASHELRTPLAIIRSTAEIASRRSRAERDYVAAFQQIIAESDRLTLLVQDLLALARGDSLSSPQMQLLSLTSLVRDVCGELRAVADARGIRMIEQLPATEFTIMGNHALLRRLLIVLLDNAITYSSPHGTVRIQLHEMDKKVHLEVADGGIGISEVDLPKIFDRFYRGEAARQAWQDGAGLGLSLAAAIARQHGAEVRVESKPGAGSTFTVAFTRS